MTIKPTQQEEQIKKMKLMVFRVATTLLYLGPLLAGLAGFGWELVPGFLVIFVCFLYVVRRSLFPRAAAEWADGRVVMHLATQVAVQALLIVICFGVGRGLGGVVGTLPPFSPIWTLAISFFAVPLCRFLAIQPDDGE